MVDLRKDHARITQLWSGSLTSRVALSVAAAFAFHHTRRGDEEVLSPHDYAGALDIAAMALACMVPIYTLDGRGEPVAVCLDLARQRFGAGATEMHCADGSILAPLAIERSEVLPTLVKIERAGIEYLAPRRATPPAGGS
jgi:hypothetical protein